MSSGSVHWRDAVEPQAARQLRARARPRHALEPGLLSGNVGHKWLLWHVPGIWTRGQSHTIWLLPVLRLKFQWVMNELAGEVERGDW